MVNNFFFFEKRAVFEIMSKKRSGSREVTIDVTIWRIRVAYWISKATRMHAPTRPGTRKRARGHPQICNIYCLFTATMIRERASFLRYMYIVCIVRFKFIHVVVTVNNNRI
jgi:hypothetical protein